MFSSQEKVANVAHGWLLKEEAAKSGVGTVFKHYWFVLFSNGTHTFFENTFISDFRHHSYSTRQPPSDTPVFKHYWSVLFCNGQRECL